MKLCIKCSVPCSETVVLLIAAVAVLLAAVLSVCFGAVPISLMDILAVLCGEDGHETQALILLAVRLPRTAAALLAGGGLALSGVLLQSVTDNELAGPNIIGVNAGAGFFCVLLLSFFPGAAAVPGVSAAAAFLGALCAALLITALSVRMNSAGVVLAGIAVTTILNAGISCLTLLDTDVLASYNAFSVGGFAGIRAEALAAPAWIVAAALAAAMLIARPLEMLSLGDGYAASLGVPVRRVRLAAIFCAAASASAVVSFAGLLGFVGLCVPHIARRILRTRGKALLLLSVLLGAAVTALADLAGRLAFAPTEVPVGIMLAFVGGPFFFWILIRRRFS